MVRDSDEHRYVIYAHAHVDAFGWVKGVGGKERGYFIEFTHRHNQAAKLTAEDVECLTSPGGALHRYDFHVFEW